MYYIIYFLKKYIIVWFHSFVTHGVVHGHNQENVVGKDDVAISDISNHNCHKNELGRSEEEAKVKGSVIGCLPNNINFFSKNIY